MRKTSVFTVDRPETDSNGDPVEVPPPSKRISGVTLWPRASEEKDGGEVNIDGWNVRLPYNDVARSLRADDGLLIEGEYNQITEPPAPYPGKAVLVKTKRVYT